MREVMNAIFYVLRAGCPWRMLAKDFPPRPAVGGAIEDRVVPERPVEASVHRDGYLRRRAVREFSEFQIGHDRSFHPW